MAGEHESVGPCAVPADTRTDDAMLTAGSTIVAISAVMFSTAGLFIRLIVVDVWTMLFWRGLFGGCLIAA